MKRRCLAGFHAPNDTVYELLLDSAIEDAAQGGLEGTTKLLSRRTGRTMTRSELERARQRAEDVGRLGEEFINAYFGLLLSEGTIGGYEWTSSDNAISPYDFSIFSAESGKSKVEVKSTTGDFGQIIHLSIAQLHEMRDSDEPYYIYRVYALDEQFAKLRIVRDTRQFGDDILRAMSGLPQGVTVDTVSVRPDSLPFEEEESIQLPDLPDHDTEG